MQRGGKQDVARMLREEAGLQLDMAQQKDYALILMDRQMPVMGGVEAIRRLAWRQAGADHRADRQRLRRRNERFHHQADRAGEVFWDVGEVSGGVRRGVPKGLAEAGFGWA